MCISEREFWFLSVSPSRDKGLTSYHGQPHTWDPPVLALRSSSSLLVPGSQLCTTTLGYCLLLNSPSPVWAQAEEASVTDTHLQTAPDTIPFCGLFLALFNCNVPGSNPFLPVVGLCCGWTLSGRGGSLQAFSRGYKSVFTAGKQGLWYRQPFFLFFSFF